MVLVILNFLCCCFQGSWEGLQVEKLEISLTSTDSFKARYPTKNVCKFKLVGDQKGTRTTLSFCTVTHHYFYACSSSANSSGKIHDILFKDPASWSSANIYLPFRKWRIYQWLKATEKKFKENSQSSRSRWSFKKPLFFLHSCFFKEKLFCGSLMRKFNALGSWTHFSFGRGL